MESSLGERIRIARVAAGLTQNDIAKHFGIARPNVTQWESGTTRPDQDRLPELAKLLNVSLDWLLNDAGEPPQVGSAAKAPKRASAEPSARLAPETDRLSLGPKDVPILGTSVGGTDAEFHLNGEVVDYARRLPGIANRPNVFGVYVSGESMVPKFEPGELVYAAPGRAPVSGDYVIVEFHPIEGERAAPAFIKRLKRRSGTKLICEQFNPPGEVEYDTRHVKAIYRIIPLAELAGF